MADVLDFEEWDSLMHVTLVVNVEREFGLRFKSADVSALKSVGDLIDLIERYAADIPRFGKLAVYDTACRLGVYLKLAPEVVYLHAGTAKGAKALGRDTYCGRLLLAADLAQRLSVMERSGMGLDTGLEDHDAV